MRYNNIASIFTLAVLSLNASCIPAAPSTDLAPTEKIHACVNNTPDLFNLPQANIERESGLIKIFHNTENVQAYIRTGIDGYMADNPERKTDQVNFFANYTAQGVDGPIEIYRAKQISFDAGTFYPYPPNEEGHALYAHKDELERGRNFTPTTQEKIIEEWVYYAVEAMDQNFKTCMGFKMEGAAVSIPEFPELNSP